MWSRTAPNFEEAHARERELNARQLEVLKLIERGHTNREIADLLGLTVDGAKWNVSEILTKLGLDSREQAAEYWSWRRARAPAVVRGLRALFGLPAAKWIAAGTAAAGFGGLGIAVLAGAGSGGPDPVPDVPTTEFYLEATVHRADPEYPTDHEFRWWHRDADHARWDYDQVGPPIKTTHSTTVIEGSKAVAFSPEGATVRVSDAAAPDGAIRRPQDVVLIGPASQPDLASLLRELSSWAGGGQAAQVVRREVVNGFQTDVIEYVSGTMWVDTSQMLIVKHDSDQFRTTLTLFERREVDAAEVALPVSIAGRPTATPFVFVPGQARPYSMHGTSLVPSYLPAAVANGTGIGSGGVCVFDSEPCLQELIYMSEAQMWENQRLPGRPLRNGVYVEIGQRLGLPELPPGLKTGLPVSVRGVTGYFDTSRTNPVLAWQEPDGRIVRIEGSQVAADELPRIAEGLTLPPPMPTPTSASTPTP